VVGGGTRKWYATIITDRVETIDDLVKSIEKFSALSEADIRGVIIALENVMQDAFAKGKIVRLDKIGSLYPYQVKVRLPPKSLMHKNMYVI